MTISRRGFLKGAAAAIGAVPFLGAAAKVLPVPAEAPTEALTLEYLTGLLQNAANDAATRYQGGYTIPDFLIPEFTEQIKRDQAASLGHFMIGPDGVYPLPDPIVKIEALPRVYYDS